MSTRVPPPPVPKARPIVKKEEPQVKKRLHPPLQTPLDPAFIHRVYITTFYLGLIWTACAWGITRSIPATGSFVGGLLMGVLLLKSQELLVSLVVAPRSKTDASSKEENDSSKGNQRREWLSRIPIALMLSLKYIVIGLAFNFVIARDWLRPEALVIGFLTVQVVILSKVVGRMMHNRLKETE